MLFEPEGPRLIPLHTPEGVEGVLAERCPIWLHIMGLSDACRISQMIAPCTFPSSFCARCWKRSSDREWIAWVMPYWW